MDDDVGSELISIYDRSGRSRTVRYDELRVQLGWNRSLTLADALAEEQHKIDEFRRNRERFRGPLSKLNRYLCQNEHRRLELLLAARRRCQQAVADARTRSQRRALLRGYYELSSFHGRVLDQLLAYVLGGSEEDHSANARSVIRFALDHLVFAMRKQARKSGGPTVFHSVEAARGAAKNGQPLETILATLLHDLVEDLLDEWSEELILGVIAREERYVQFRQLTLKVVPAEVRTAILREHAESYSDRAAGIYYGVGLALYEHVRLFKAPERYCECLHSTMQMLAHLSRTRDTSYYNYLEQVLHPRSRRTDPIERRVLLEALAQEVAEPELLLDDYLAEVDNFYRTPLGEFPSREEEVRNAQREVLAKILDRLNNTRDMDRADGFSVAKRLYGAGYKNIYLLQAIEEYLAVPGLTSQERRIIEMKFLNKPKVAALHQVRSDLAFLERQIGTEAMGRLRGDLETYKRRSDFHRITSAGDSPYDGIILLFNEAILGNKRGLERLEQDPLREAGVALAFQAVLEYFLAYPLLMPEDRRTPLPRKGGGSPSLSGYRILGLGAGLEGRALEGAPGVEDLPIKSFRREVVR